jgi:hypothetical protein
MSKQECQALQNIKYKTMLLNTTNKKTFTSSVSNDIDNIDTLLDNECNLNKKECWNKLDKSVKMDKINELIESLANKHSLNIAEKANLSSYLSTSLDKKNLYKNKDVIYIKESGKLENIPTLHFNNTTRKFTLKKQQQSSTSKSLGPTRKVNRSKSNNNKNNKNNTDKNKSTKLLKSPNSPKSPKSVNSSNS